MPREFSAEAEAAIADYLERTDNGETVDREAFLESHAEVAIELQSFFANDELVEEFAGGVGRTVSPERRVRATTDGDTLHASRGLVETTDGTPGIDTMLTEHAVPGRFGRYELKKLLGEGAMGSVYLARDTQLGRKVALKIPKVESEASADFHERFLREARAAATLSHPNICSVHDVGEVDGTHFISMEFVEGHPLSDYISGKLQPVRQALKLVRKLALALAEAHSHGVVHRDLKPDNVMVSKKGEPVVMDFGLARHAESGDLRATASGGLMGTPAYMSPEQVDGQSDKIGPLSDQYSLGVVLYELLTGDIPFNGSLASVLGQIVNTAAEPPSTTRPEIPPEVEAVCLRMMAKQPGDRFDSLTDVAEAIAGLLKGETTIPGGELAPPREGRVTTRESPKSSRTGGRRTTRESKASVKKSRTKRSTSSESAAQKGKPEASPAHERKKHVEALLEAWKFQEAKAVLRDLATDPDLADWVREKQAEAKQGPKKARENTDALAATARQLLEKHDFAGAVEVTEDVPREFRTPAYVEVRREAESKLEKAGNMEFEIEQLLLDRKYDDLEKPVQKLLAFQPTNRLARKLQAAMEGTVTSGSRMDVHGVKIELDELKRSSDSILAGFLPIAIGVVVIFGGLTWGAMHLLWAAPSLTAKFAIDAALLNGSYEFLVDGEQRNPDEMQNGLKGLAAGVHEIVVKKDGEVVAKVNVEIPGDETPTIHIVIRDGRVIVSTELPDDDTQIAGDADPPAKGGPQAGNDTLATASPITIPANSRKGYEIGPVPAGTKLEIQYVSGKWKAWGSQADISPDKTEDRGGGSCHLVLADLGDGAGNGTAVATVPEGTTTTPFAHTLAQDATNLVLRIKGRSDLGWKDNPGKVQYKVLVAGKSLGGTASTTPDDPPVDPVVGSGFAARETLPPVSDPSKLKSGLVVCEFARPQVQFVQDVKKLPRPSEFGSPVGKARVIANADKWTFDEKRNALATGYLRIDDAGTYEFSANAFHDRAELYLDGQRVCQRGDGDKTFVTVDLEPGYVPFVAVGHVWSRGYCEIRWRTPGNGSATTIPANRFFHDPADVARIDADYAQAEREFAARVPPAVDVDTAGLDPWLVRRTAPRLPSQMPKVVTIPRDDIVAKLRPGTEQQKGLEGFKPNFDENTVVIGYLKVTTPGRYHFVTWAWNDAVELYVGGKRVCRKGDDALTVGWIDLKPGLVPLVYVAYPTIKGAPDFFWRPPTQRAFSRFTGDVFFSRPGETVPSQLQGTIAAAEPSPIGNGVVGSRAGEVRQYAGDLEMCWIPPGKFTMGTPPGEPGRSSFKESRVDVDFSTGLWLARTEVTQSRWRDLMGTTPWTGREDVLEGDAIPATYVSWFEADKFCRLLTERERTAGRLPAGWEYRLPTEAEWEYACRAGTSTTYWFGDDPRQLTDREWMHSNTLNVGKEQPQPVGTKSPNPWGLYDISGNVMEWTADTLAPELPGGTDPLVDHTTRRTYKGGGWRSSPKWCRSGARLADSPSDVQSDRGFRVALGPVTPPAAGGQSMAVVVPGAAAGEQRRIGGALDLPARWCPPGSFRMGSPANESGRSAGEDQVDVTLTSGFWIGGTELAVDHWRELMGTEPWTGKPDFDVANERPAVYVSWEAADEFCNRLTARERVAGRLPSGWAYRLPTEAEWEYACRAGTTTAYWFGNDPNDLPAHERVGIDDGKPSSSRYVATGLPNPWGIHDMLGNVREWCADVERSPLPGGTDPFTDGVGRRSIRGGNLRMKPENARAAFRSAADPGTSDYGIGLRIVLGPDPGDQ